MTRTSSRVGVALIGVVMAAVMAAPTLAAAPSGTSRPAAAAVPSAPVAQTLFALGADPGMYSARIDPATGAMTRLATLPYSAADLSGTGLAVDVDKGLGYTYVRDPNYATNSLVHLLTVDTATGNLRADRSLDYRSITCTGSGYGLPFPYGLAFDRKAGQLVGFDTFGPACGVKSWAEVSIDPTTGALQTSGAPFYDSRINFTYRYAAFDPGKQTYYTAYQGSPRMHLFHIDPGSYLDVPLNNFYQFRGLAFDTSSGQLLGMGQDLSSVWHLVRFDPIFGTTTVLNPFSLDFVCCADGQTAVDPVTHRYFTIAWDKTVNSNRLAVLDTATGDTLVTGPLSTSTVSGLALVPARPRLSANIVSAIWEPIPHCLPGQSGNCTQNDGSYFSIPSAAEANSHPRSFTVVFQATLDGVDVTPQVTIDRLVVSLLAADGTSLQGRIVDEGLVGTRVQRPSPNTLRARVTFDAGSPSAVATVPPPSTTVLYQFTLQVTDAQGNQATSAPLNSNPAHALWRMPAGLARYGPCTRAAHDAEGPGGDNWVSRSTYEWMDANRALLPAINDATFEHGLNLGPHTSHATGDDLDLFHVYALAGASMCSGTAYYNTLAATARIATGRGPAARDARTQLLNWIAATRDRFDQLLPMPQVRLIIYAEGNRVVRNGRTVLPGGWARQLIMDGQVVDQRGRVLLHITDLWQSPGAMSCRAGFRPPCELRFRADHNNHIHLSLNPA